MITKEQAAKLHQLATQIRDIAIQQTKADISQALLGHFSDQNRAVRQLHSDLITQRAQAELDFAKLVLQLEGAF